MKAASPASPQFASMRNDLAKYVADVAKNTSEEFGKPWGLLAMDLVSGRRAAASVRIASSRIALAVDRPALAAVAS
jgi:hypothetical protein